MTGEALPVDKEPGSAPFRGGTHSSRASSFIVSPQTQSRSRPCSTSLPVSNKNWKSSAFTQARRQNCALVCPARLNLAIATASCLGTLQMARQTAIVRAVAVLLISCPCAIGIAAPLAEAHLMNRLAKMGVIVSNRAAFEWLGV